MMMGGSTGMSTGMEQASGGGGAALPAPSGPVSGEISIEGSSTVFPITQRVAEAFQRENPDTQITVGDAGSGDGFEALCEGNVPISDASRPIDQEEEVPICEENGIEFIELPVGLDGISVVVNGQNQFASEVTLDQLNQVWAPDSQLADWSEIDPQFPSQPLSLYGPGTESGTFDFFTEVVNGEEGASRTDYQASEDDNVLVRGVSGDPNALGYFGYSYYAENSETLKALRVDGVEVNEDTIASGEYPLSRPLFIYVAVPALEESEAVRAFVNFYLQENTLSQSVADSRYVPLPAGAEDQTRTQYVDMTTGTVFNANGELPGDDIEAALQQSQ